MSFWRLLKSPGGVDGCRASVEMAIRTNLKRANQGSTFENCTLAVSTTLRNRYRVVRRTFDELTLLPEASPFGWQPAKEIPELLAEYIVDQEFPGKASSWLDDRMEDILRQLIISDNVQANSAVSAIFLMLNNSSMQAPHWGKWLSESLVGQMYDVAWPVLNDRYPHLFDKQA